MALGSANRSQPRLSSASRSRRRQRSNQQNIDDSKGGIKFLAWAAIIAAAMTFVMGLITCTKLYDISSVDPGLVKKTVFMVSLVCNSISVLTSVVALTHLIWAQRQTDFQLVQKAMLRAMALVTVAFVSILVAFMVGVCYLMLIRLPWQTYFIRSSLF